MVKAKLTDYAFIGFVICFAGWRALFPLRHFDDPLLWAPRSLFFLGALATWPGGAGNYFAKLWRGKDFAAWQLRYFAALIVIMLLLRLWVQFFGVF